MVFAAKEGNFEKAFEILGTPEDPKKSYLINVIPESRRWGILHQAIHWNNMPVVKKLLQYDACDNDLPTKYCKFDNGDVGVKTTAAIARMYGHKKMEDWLMDNYSNQGDGLLETFQQCGRSKGIQLFSVTLAAYKNTFHPDLIDPSLSLMDIMEAIFKDVNESEQRLKAVKEQVLEAVRGVSEQAYKTLAKSSSREEFYMSLINVYTAEAKSDFLYAILSSVMRRQKERNYCPAGKDLSLGPYILMYQIVLMFWPGLKKENGTTYRKMLLKDEDLGRYVPDTKFKWPSFVSSSTFLKNTEAFPTTDSAAGNNSVYFVIDNKSESQWKPRDIHKYADLIENERIYPAGAEFLITRKELRNEGTYVYMTLQ